MVLLQPEEKPHLKECPSQESLWGQSHTRVFVLLLLVVVLEISAKMKQVCRRRVDDECSVYPCWPVLRPEQRNDR